MEPSTNPKRAGSGANQKWSGSGRGRSGHASRGASYVCAPPNQHGTRGRDGFRGRRYACLGDHRLVVAGAGSFPVFAGRIWGSGNRCSELASRSRRTTTTDVEPGIVSDERLNIGGAVICISLLTEPAGCSSCAPCTLTVIRIRSSHGGQQKPYRLGDRSSPSRFPKKSYPSQ